MNIEELWNSAYIAALSRLPARDADVLKLLIMRVQAALYSKGYDPGAIDGVLTPETQSALRMFQLAHGIRATGTMTTPTLDALGVRI
ncbi:peptidoglycan-binding protein [Stenotrophomonas maltophilia]|uniref:peptidoglycan-binding protein n=1 Tax=Stenotrophomonas maltophilia TaxID=40324 RepID=UPI00195462B7|nr:peptidoglycan-binding protein [Stenotrophomonas maltophilia]MBN5111799.1 peptidoglycan-binding protein [Stenotrophomonas maltophilia]